MRISKANLTVTTAAEPEGIRPAIEAIYFDRAGTVSADGFRLTFVPYPDGPAGEDDGAVGMLLPIEAAARIVAVASNTDEILVGRGPGEPPAIDVNVRDPDSAGAVRFTVRATVADYPNWRKIVPSAFAHEVCLNREFLQSALAALDQLGAYGVRCAFNGPAEPVLFEGVGFAPGEAAPFVVVMPIVGAGSAR